MLSPKTNTYRMFRPPEISGELLLVQELNLTSEQKELYNSIFYEYVLNMENELSRYHHNVIKKTATSAMAYALFLMDQNHPTIIIEEARKEFLKTTKDISFFDDLPDTISKLDYLISTNLNIILKKISSEGLDGLFLNPIESDVFNDLENIFMHVSYSVCGNILDQYKNLLDSEENEK
jgi:hypothetical protein